MMIRMFTTSLSACLLAGAALSVSAPALAQRNTGSASQRTMPQMRPMPSPGTSQGTPTQDRMRDTTRDRDQMRDGTGPGTGTGTGPGTGSGAGTGNRDMVRDRDMQRDQDRMRVTQTVDGQIQSMQMLTQQERLQMRDRISAAGSDAARNQIRSEYQNTIRERAGDLGVDAPFGPQRDGAGSRDGYQLSQMLSEQERLQFHQRMRAAGSDQDRDRIRTEMQTMTRDRARQMGIDMPEWYGERLREGSN
jgi:hypothetical protein